MARRARVDPSDPNAVSLLPFDGLTDEQRQKKAENVRTGNEIRSELPMFPEARRCRDPFWALLFVVVAGAGIAYIVTQAPNVQSAINSRHSAGEQLEGGSQFIVQARRLQQASQDISMGSLISTGVVGGLGGIAVSLAFLTALKSRPESVIPCTIIAVPVFYFLLMLAMFATGAYFYISLGNSNAGMYFGIAGLVFFLCFACAACRAMALWAMVPFTVQVAKAVGEVITQHPGLMMLSLFCSFLGFVWVTMCCVGLAIAFILADAENNHSTENDSTMMIGVAGFYTLITVWGILVFQNMGSLSYAVVFGRWYKQIENNTVGTALGIACCTSFGSICFGSLIVAFVRAAEAMARQAQREAREEGNIVVCLLLCALQCFLACIGDFLEYFNAWAYVQCAIRNASFVEAVKITWAMCTCANVMVLIQDLLINWAATSGILFASLAGLAFGGGVGYFMGGAGLAGFGGGFGFVCAVMIGGSVCEIISTGTKTILVLWAEDSEPLRRSHPDLHESFEERIERKLNAES